MHTKSKAQETAPTKQKAIYPKLIKSAEEAPSELFMAFSETLSQGALAHDTKVHLLTQLKGLEIHNRTYYQDYLDLFLKLCKFDECDFDATQELRWRIIRQGQQVLSSPTFNGDYNEYLRLVSESCQVPQEDLAVKLYQDLPENARLIAFHSISPEQFNKLFNVKQVQKQLAQCVVLTLRFKHLDKVELKKLLQFMQRHRLLFEMLSSDKNRHLSLEISGPLSINGAPLSYGQSFCLLFSFLLSLPDWELDAQIKNKYGSGKMHLSRDKHQHYFTTYQHDNEENTTDLEKVVVAFNEKYPDYTVEVAGEVLSLGGQELLMPDLKVISKEEAKIFYIELLTPSSQKSLTKKIKALSKNKLAPIVFFGMEKNSPKPVLQDEKEFLEKYGFEYNDFPTPSKIYSLIKIGSK